MKRIMSCAIDFLNAIPSLLEIFWKKIDLVKLINITGIYYG